MGDAALVARWRAGDADAFQSLVDRHYQTVYRLARLLTGREMDAEDVCQEVWLRAWNKGWQLRKPERFRSWLTGIAVNQSRNHISRRRPSEALPSDVVSGGATDPAEIADRTEALARLDGALDGLEWFSRAVVVLHVMADVKGPRIAELLGCSNATVYRALDSALKQLERAVGSPGG